MLRGDVWTWEVNPDENLAVTIGVFDSVHRGHREVIGRLVDDAAVRNLTPAALTFDVHPLQIVAPERAPALLSTVAQRLEELASLGVEIGGVLPFRQVRNMPAETFAAEILGERLRSRLVVVGTDFRFGLDRTGDVELLRRVGGMVGFEVEAVHLLSEEAGRVSSTHIREMISAGRVEEAAAELGRPYEIRGEVVHGDSRGKGIGFPTANLRLAERQLVPAEGVYVVEAALEPGQWLRGAANVGTRPTFGEGPLVMEVFLLDFDGDFYGQELAVRFRRRLRGEMRFENVGALVAQLEKDVAAVREFFAN